MSSALSRPTARGSTSATTTPTSAASGPCWAGSPGCRCTRGSNVRWPSIGRTWRTTYELAQEETPMILPANPAANYLAHRDEIDQAIRRALAGGMYIIGQDARKFKERF